MNPQSKNIIRNNNFQTVSGNVNISSIIQQTDLITQCLMPSVALGASFDSHERDPPPKCHPGTRKEILKNISDWAAVKQESGKVMWLHGPAGAGKSAIAQTICETCAGGKSRAKLAASFFFSRGHPTRGIASTFFPTIAFQLAISIPELHPHLTEVITRNSLVVSSSMETQTQFLVATPFRKYIQEVDSEQPWIVVIDGVDECRGNNDQARLINHLLDLTRIYLLPLSILIVGRPEAHIKDIFYNDKIPDLKMESLYGDHNTDNDIRLFFEDEFANIRRSKRHFDVMHHINEPWPSPSVVEKLVRKSDGYYIYVATVLKFVDAEYYSPIERLDQVMNVSQDPDSTETPFAELDGLYTQILSTCADRRLLKTILNFCLTFKDLVSPMGMVEMLGLPEGKIHLTLRSLHSLINIKYMRFYHASFSDFLLDVERAGDFYIDRKSFLLKMLPQVYWWLLDNILFNQHNLLKIRRCSLTIGRSFDKSTIIQCWKFLFQDMQKWRNLCQSSRSWTFRAQKLFIDVIFGTMKDLVAIGIAHEDQFKEIFIMIFEEHLWRSASPNLRRFVQILSSIWTLDANIHISCAVKFLHGTLSSLHLKQPHIPSLLIYFDCRGYGSSSDEIAKKFLANLNRWDVSSSGPSEQYDDAAVIFFYATIITSRRLSALSLALSLWQNVHVCHCVFSGTGTPTTRIMEILLYHFLHKASSNVRNMILYFQHVITVEIFSNYEMMLRAKGFKETILTAVAENSRLDVSSSLLIWRSILKKSLIDDEVCWPVEN